MPITAGSSMRPFAFPLPIGLFHLDGDPDPVPDPDPAPDPARSFSQEEVDRIVRDRLLRVKMTPPADYDDLKAKAARLAEIEAENQTELEKANARAEQIERESQARVEAANKRLLEAAVLTEATKQHALKPEHLHRLIDTDQVTVGDDGQVTGVAEAVQAFLEANPEYVGTRGPGPADQGARGGGANQLSSEQLESMSHEEIVKAEDEGRLDAILAGKA